MLEDEVSARIESRAWGLVELTGPSGSGKSTALAHLAHSFFAEPFVVLSDAPQATDAVELLAAVNDRLVIVASLASEILGEERERWALAAWGSDEWIEYLLACHREQCASVMQRVNAGSRAGVLGGSPALWRPVLDHLAADERQRDIIEALRQELYARLVTVESRDAARAFCFATFHGVSSQIDDVVALWDSINALGRDLLHHDIVQLLLAAEFVAAVLAIEQSSTILRLPLPERLVRETAALVRDRTEQVDRLRAVLTGGGDEALQPTAASLVYAADPSWMPRPGYAPLLAGAFLSGARWRRVRLARLNISRADLTGADLTEARLKHVCAHDTRLDGACLHGATLKRFSALDAQLADADLSHANARAADFRGAGLRGANLEGALLRRARFEGADLRGSRFARADLTHATFAGSQVEGADFTGADLWGANLWHVPLRLAEFGGARFIQASLIGCDLEFMSLPGANFTGAKLLRAYLTGSRMPCAQFYRADLRDTGLAEIEWEGVDLREADLRGATFHMGSSRSGLVGSPIASEGSRTGFYTDEYLEQGFKAPEEIRKANLCGADLRGANIEGIDFYLVDLRGARYTLEQERQFRRSCAILEARV
ncbi:MAG TPA: pentapeptide repeat-containing protein [Pirellulales bacterium]|nr:pentapeptide repeat-containing protein [Pirellulales bacterium]